MLIGPALLGAGLGLISLKNPAIYIPLICVGGVLLILGFCIGICVSFSLGVLRLKRLRNAVDAESLKYSTKLPIPTKWHLNSYTTQRYIGRRSPTTITHYYIVIDIGNKVNSAVGSNRSKPDGNLNEPSSYIV
ncbi:unnamed protein product [Adineta steineri]|uniref:Uncharacterized protein n=1 Tax=Adineta steineri TaxID=433720 RepID=A0A816DAQ4_9BILA|nr:unnamed protein product [Adineta steineri]CAF1634874.1 unnamed protein product [Adineta steineri]